MGRAGAELLSLLLPRISRIFYGILMVVGGTTRWFSRAYAVLRDLEGQPTLALELLSTAAKMVTGVVL